MKNMKRTLALVLSLVFLFSAVPTVSAVENSKLTIASVGGRKGETVSIAVSLSEVNGIAGGGFNIQYDNTLLTLLSVEQGAALSGTVPTINQHYADNLVRVSFAGSAALKDAGTLIILHFRISEAAPLGEIPIRAEKVKFYDVNSAAVPHTVENGAVIVESVSISIASESCLPGQAVSLPITLCGGLSPSGGEFEVHYNNRMLSGGSVKAEAKMGNVGINLSYNIFEEGGYIKVSWAAAQPITELGQLCTVIFAVSETAVGDTSVTLENIKFYDENGVRLDHSTPKAGTVTAVTNYNETPVLYVVGGQLDETGTQATVQVAVDGAGLVCGGTFTLRYDTTLCTLTDVQVVKPNIATNPEAGSPVNGEIRVSWAEDRAALDNETILELRFALTQSGNVPLLLENVVLKDKNGLTMEGTRVHSGRIGIQTDLQAPITTLQNREEGIVINTTLYDAQFCGTTKTEGARFVLTAYTNGRMQAVSVPAESVRFDHNGIAQVDLTLPFDRTPDSIFLFVTDAAGNMCPLSERVCINLA